FVPSPFDATSQLYRTGDLARWLDEDELEFLGRDDRQVKLHGQRIELDEITTTLMSHPEVTAAAVQLNRLETEAPEAFCKSCGLSSRYPEIRFDAAGICSTCTAFEGYRQELDQYFRSLPELEARFRQLRDRRQGDYDCLMLLSGGKDSTYVLYQLAAMDLDILTFTLDNGYISEGAKANIRRVTEHLGIDHVFATTEHMPEIFADSLARYSNVCNGCFKTIYTLSMNLARERGIPSIVTGLARGQLFETRLVDMCSAEQFDPATIDTTVAAARKAYHRIPDAPTRLLPVKIFEDDRIFDEIEFIDFFRYCDVELAEMYSFLADYAPWVRPQDTGRSTNCLINDTGIHVHKLERGYHNYALPYSWDVRLGHKTRSAAMAELDDQIDVDRVSAILAEIGYQPKDRGSEQSLTAFYTAGEELASRALRDWLAEHLPPYMLPTHFIRLPALPLTANGKVDYAGLPQATRRTAQDTTPPRNDLERALTELWRARFGLTQIGIHEDFFELGGDSVLAIQLVDTAAADGLSLEPRQLFEYPTIAELATELASSTAGRAAQRAPAAPQVAASESDRARVLAALKQRSEDRSGHG
ncbi:MAG: phosphopantetheine-binding protein, partial [Pseudomonadota bacterium]